MPDRIRIGLLQCGYVHPDVAAVHGDYPALWRELLAPYDVELTTFDVQTGPVPDPADPATFDGWLVSGSASSTYDSLDWIPPVEDLLRTLVEREIPLVAICFGHQLLAQALGTPVARSDAGWGVGVHAYELVGPPRPWMQPPPVDGFRLIASHQDQVTALPRGAELLARTDHCPIAAFTVGHRALAIQAHPEFTASVSAGLLGLRRERIGAASSDAALATLDDPMDRDLVASWMATFWRS